MIDSERLAINHGAQFVTMRELGRIVISKRRADSLRKMAEE